MTNNSKAIALEIARSLRDLALADGDAADAYRHALDAWAYSPETFGVDWHTLCRIGDEAAWSEVRS